MLTSHIAAAEGDLRALMRFASLDINSVKKVDANGWVSLIQLIMILNNFNQLTTLSTVFIDSIA